MTVSHFHFHANTVHIFVKSDKICIEYSQYLTWENDWLEPNELCSSRASSRFMLLLLNTWHTKRPVGGLSTLGSCSDTTWQIHNGGPEPQVLWSIFFIPAGRNSYDPVYFMNWTFWDLWCSNCIRIAFPQCTQSGFSIRTHVMMCDYTPYSYLSCISYITGLVVAFRVIKRRLVAKKRLEGNKVLVERDFPED